MCRRLGQVGHEGAIEMLSAGANDLGGVLINESITRAAGAAHGQMWSAEAMRDAISACALPAAAKYAV